jgi:Contractile injection system tube protein
MKIYACDAEGNRDDKQVIELQVNPTTVTVNHKIEYCKDTTLGSTGDDQKYNKTPAASISFKVLFDDTGVIEGTTNGVTDQINKFMDLCYRYHGEDHQPNKVVIVWGELQFKLCLNSANVVYKLFSPEGKPLRAELECNFSEYKEKKEEQKESGKKSPDVSHVIEVKAGDRLPSLCKKVYRNARLFPEIARINGITDFRRLEPGTKLFFPSLK